MWVNRELFDLIVADNKRLDEMNHAQRGVNHDLASANVELRAQKAKDDITIDWMRHRINALEKQNAILLQKAAGVIMPVPEIVPTRPGSLTVPDFSSLPSFEDVGDVEAVRLGIAHDDAGFVEFRDDMKTGAHA